MIFGVVAPRLETFYTRFHAFERACVFIEFARYHEERGSQEERLKQLRLAFRCIQVVRHHDQTSQESVQAHDEADLTHSIDRFSQSLDNNLFGMCRQTRHSENYFEEVARKDPLLSRWWLGESFESALSSKIEF